VRRDDDGPVARRVEVPAGKDAQDVRARHREAQVLNGGNGARVSAIMRSVARWSRPITAEELIEKVLY
jgi:hypothetical protein